MSFWSAGDVILWRYRRELAVPVESVAPMIVVADDERQLVAWLPAGTPILRPVLPDGRDLRAVGPVEMYASGRALRRDLWYGHGSLRIAPTGAAWSVFLFWDDVGMLRHWYVNLESPHRRDEIGIVCEDHIVDLVIDPDRTVRWKDLDELDGAVVARRFTRAEADGFIAEAQRVLALVGAWGSPFCDGWEHWRPDPTWTPPQLPADLHAAY